MHAGDVLVAGERMADQHRVAARRVERAVGLVGDLERAQLDAGIELERLVRAKMSDSSESCGCVRLTRRGTSARSRALLVRSVIAPYRLCAPGIATVLIAGRFAKRFSGNLAGLPMSTFSLISRPGPPINALMAKHTTKPPSTSADLRQEIDRIDEAMHGLLMERGEIIDRLIAVKKSQETGSAFRPAREADMMRRLVSATKASCRSTPPRASGASSSRLSPMCRRRSRSMPTCRPAMR